MPEVLERWKWRTAVSSPWRHEEIIARLEMRAALTAVRWASTSPHFPCSRLLLLTDSAVVAGALAKGRSSAFGILRIQRHIAAALLSSAVALSVRWIGTDFNPADAPSRLGMPAE